jgi:hypothetical protein
MYTFFTEWLFVLGMLVGLGLVGGFVVAPFRHKVRFPALVAPFAGLLVLCFGTALGYNFLGVPLALGLMVTALIGITATAWQVRGAAVRPCWRSVAFQIALAAALAGVVTAISASTTIMLGSPGVQTSLGSDHLGYSHMADWILAHPPWQRPRVDPSVPYESWPEAMFSDARFASFAALAIVAMLRGSSALFAYDSASAIVLTVTILGVAGVFARGWITLLLLTIGLLSAHWYDYPRTGYFAKTIGFAGAFFVSGLFMLTRAPLRPTVLFSLLLLTGSLAAAYNAEAPTMFLVTIAGSFLAARVVLGGLPMLRNPFRAVRAIWQHALVLVMMVPVILFARSYVAVEPKPTTMAGSFTGHLAAIVNPAASPAYVTPPWNDVMHSVADLELQARPLSGLSPEILDAALLFSLFCWLILGAMAWYRRDTVAVGLTTGPIALLAFLAPLPSPAAQWTTYQLPGTFYPLALCAAARLLDGLPLAEARSLTRRLIPITLGALVLANVGLHVPRFVGAVDRFAGKAVPPWTQFSQVELDGLAAAIGGKTVRVDINQPHLSYVVLLELVGRRGVDVQWGPSSWRFTLGYRPWPVPEPTKPADFVLRAITEPDEPGATIVYTTRQYRLVRPPAP